jgi:serine/threonine protein kinase
VNKVHSYRRLFVFVVYLQLERERMLEEAKLHHSVTQKLPATAAFVAFIAVVDGVISDPDTCNSLRIRQGEEGTGIVLELQRGGTLDELIHPKPGVVPISLKVATLLKICAMVANGVADFHAINMVHGDIKPANILLSDPVRGDYDDPAVKLADLGLSRIRESSATPTFGASTMLATQSGGKVGCTPAYTAPELMDVCDEGWMIPSRSTDVYALAITTWEVLRLYFMLFMYIG